MRKVDTIKCGRITTQQEVSLREDSAAVFHNEFKEGAVKMVIDGKLTIAVAVHKHSRGPY